jgi:hypothetical protein
MFGSKIDRVNYRRLSSFDTEAIELNAQRFFVRGEILLHVDLIAANEPQDKRLVGRFIGINNRSSRSQHARVLGFERARAIYQQAIADGRILFREERNGLRSVTLKDLEIFLAKISN